MEKDMEMYLEEIIKKTNPQEYIKILEEDRQDFAEEINRLQEKIDKAIERLEKEIKASPSCGRKDNAKLILINYEKLLNILQGENNE